MSANHICIDELCVIIIGDRVYPKIFTSYEEANKANKTLNGIIHQHCFISNR